MFRLIGALILLLASACPAIACIAAPTYDPNFALEHHTRGDIVRMTEVIVEGVIEPNKPDDGIAFARMHVDRVWKGAVASDVVVIMGLSLCPLSPPLGERMRFSARLVEKRLLLVKDSIALTPERAHLIATHDDFLVYRALNRTTPMLDLPLQDPELDRLLVQYQADTDAMRQRAETGDR